MGGARPGRGGRSRREALPRIRTPAGPLTRRRARPPELNSSCASDPGRSPPIDSEAACRDCLACLVPPECAAPRPRRQQAMQAMEATIAPTKVIYGVNELDLDLAGKSIRGIWKVLEQVLNIPRDAAVSVNGERVQDDYVVRPGDEIEFQKQAGGEGLGARAPP